MTRHVPSRTLVWPPAAPAPAGMPHLSGHTDTLPDIVGRIERGADLTIFTEGNHFPALLPVALTGFREWLDTNRHAPADNILLVTLPQPMVVAAIEHGGIATGSAVITVDPERGIYPDLVMGGERPLRRLRQLGIVERRATVFARSLGPALLVRSGNPLGLRSLRDLAGSGARLVMAGRGEPGARDLYLAALAELTEGEAARQILDREVGQFEGRLGIQHRDVPHALAMGLGDAGIIFRHLAEHYARTFPALFEAVPLEGAERFSSPIALARTARGLQPDMAGTFAEYFLETARDIYPAAGFARLEEPEYRRRLDLEQTAG